MNEPTVAALVERLERLERAHVRLKRIGAIGLAAFAALLLMGQSPPSALPKVMTAEGFLLHGPGGKVRAALFTSGADALPGMNFLDKDGKLRMALGLLGDGAPSVRLFDETGRPRLALGETTLLGTRAEERRPVSSIVLFGKDGTIVWKSP